MESNIFVINADEITVHWKVTVPEEAYISRYATEGVNVARLEMMSDLYKSTQALLARLKEDGFKPDPGKAARKSGGNPNWKPQAAPVDANGNKITCPNCSSDVWDNRQKNKERSAAGQKAMPEFKCKKECGWVQWPPREGNGQQADANPFDSEPDPVSQFV